MTNKEQDPFGQGIEKLIAGFTDDQAANDVAVYAFILSHIEFVQSLLVLQLLQSGLKGPKVAQMSIDAALEYAFTQKHGISGIKSDTADDLEKSLSTQIKQAARRGYCEAEIKLDKYKDAKGVDLRKMRDFA